MPKVTVSSSQRLREFPTDGFKCEGSRLFCTFCSDFVNFERKSVVKAHTESAKHLRIKCAETSDANAASTNKRNRAETIPMSFQRVKSNKDKCVEMVSAFCEAGIPLYVFRKEHFRLWLSNATSIDPVPSETTLRTYLTECGTKDFEETISICQREDVYIVIDESTDTQNRKIVNTLICPLGVEDATPRLVSSTFIDRCNAETITELVLISLEKVGVARNQFVALLSDNAPYMLAAGRRLGAVCSRLVHSTCWAHILHLCAEELRSNHKVADRYLACIKNALSKAHSRRELLLDCLNENGVQRLPPVPVITRWCTWLEAVKYHFENYTSVQKWIKAEEEDSAAIQELKELVDSADLQVELQRVATVAEPICREIKVLEAENTSATEVWLRLNTLLELLQMAAVPCTKLLSYLGGRHPSVNFWKQVQVLDPAKADYSVFENGIPQELQRFSALPVPAEERAKYMALLREGIIPAVTPVKFWKMSCKSMPTLSKLALRAISVPSSSAAVERSFSQLNWILNKRRTSFTEENLDIHLRLTYNSGDKEIV